MAATKWLSHICRHYPQTIYEAACWAADTYTFAKFYWLDAVANANAEFVRSVLTLSPLPQHHTSVVGTTYSGNTTSVCSRAELQS